MPDADYMGYIQLTGTKFQEKYKGDKLAVLHHLFQKHLGQTVEVYRCRHDTEFCLSDLDLAQRLELHRPHWNTLWQTTPQHQHGCNKSKTFFAQKKRSADGDTQRHFLSEVRGIEHPVYKPISQSTAADGASHCVKYTIGYFSLPAMVFELCWHYDLLSWNRRGCP